MFSWTRRMGSLKPCLDFFLPKSEFFLSQSKKITKKLSIFQKSFAKRFPGHLDWCFGNLAINVLQKSETFLLKLQKLQKIKVFSKKIPKAFIWTRRMLFWHPLAKVFPQKPINFWSKYGKDWQTITFPK